MPEVDSDEADRPRPKVSVAIVGIILNQSGLNLPNPRQIERCTWRVRKRDLIMGFCCMQRPQRCLEAASAWSDGQGAKPS